MEYGFDTGIFYLKDRELKDALELFADRGVRYIEHGMDFLRELEEDAERKFREISEITESLGLYVVQVHAPYIGVYEKLGDMDEEIYRKTLKRMLRWVRYTSILGSNNMIVHPAELPKTIEMSFVDAVEFCRRRNLEVARELSKAGEEYGVTISFENEYGLKFGCSPEDLIEIVQVNPDILGICFDVGHANIRQLNLVSFLKKISRFLTATHLHDNNGVSDEHLPPMMGSINWRELIIGFKEIGYSKPLILEVGSGKNYMTSLNRFEISRMVLDTLLGK